MSMVSGRQRDLIAAVSVRPRLARGEPGSRAARAGGECRSHARPATALLDASQQHSPGARLVEAHKVDIGARGVQPRRPEVSHPYGDKPLVAPWGSPAKAARHSAMAKGEAR